LKADCHTHSIFSSDGELSIEKMTATALKKGLSYLAVTDHVDFDALLEKNRAPSYWKQPDMELYAATVQRLKPAAADKGLYLAFGAEMGFDADPAAQRPAKELVESTPFDVIINSVHFAGGLDLYFPEYFKGRTKKQAYELYLDTVYESLFAEFSFDIVGHLGYVTRQAPYPDKEIRLSESGEKIDRILKRIIASDKTLEVNTNHGLNPNAEILARYFELGGRNVSFGSDAHHGGLCDGWDEAVKVLKDIGFSELSVFKRRKRESVPL
jgi:histidinol phosphate phosphatase hisJ family